MVSEDVINWLLKGDVSIQYQVARDILNKPKSEVDLLQQQIAVEGWGARLLSKRQANGHWGISFYQPKWTSTHYTLLDLKTIGLQPDNAKAGKSAEMVLALPPGTNGGVNLAASLNKSDVCVNGMVLNYASYFRPEAERLEAIVDFLLDVQMRDGGWNCNYLQTETVHSSVHSTLSVLEGLLQFRRTGRKYRRREILDAEKEAVEFLLKHRLYQSHRTGKTIDPRFVRLSFPDRWRYNILRCLDFMHSAGVAYNDRMQDALDILMAKRDGRGKWPLQEKHKGAVHFDMEKIGAPSRWNTLRALRVINYYL